MIENQRQKEQSGLFAIFGLEIEESDENFVKEGVEQDIVITKYNIPICKN